MDLCFWSGFGTQPESVSEMDLCFQLGFGTQPELELEMDLCFWSGFGTQPDSESEMHLCLELEMCCVSGLDSAPSVISFGVNKLYK